MKKSANKKDLSTVLLHPQSSAELLSPPEYVSRLIITFLMVIMMSYWQSWKMEPIVCVHFTSGQFTV